MRNAATFLMAYAVVAVSTIQAAEPEWPNFRGPFSNPSVTSANLPEKWSQDSNIEWKTGIPGLGWSSPIVSGNNIFITTVTTDGQAKRPQAGTTYSNDYTAELKKQGLQGKELRDRLNARDFEFPNEVSLHYFLYSIALDTGKIQWKQEFYTGRPPGGRHRKNSFCSETPVTDGKRVYVYINNLGVFAYDFNGKQVWNAPMESFPTVHDFGTASSPTLVNDLLLFVNDNEKEQFIAALNKHTGKQVWRTPRTIHLQGSDRQTGWSSPYIWKHALRTEVVTIGPGVAISYDLEGKELWRLGGMSAMPIPSPYAHDGLLYLNGGSGKAIAAVKPGASGDLTTPEGAKIHDSVAWLQPKAGTYLPTQLAYEGGIYVLTHTGILTRFDAKTGVQTFKARVGEGGDFTSSPWAYNGRIFCIDEEGRTYVIRAGEKYELLGFNDLGEMALATPALLSNRLILRTDRHLYSIRSLNGRK
jgi:outer membrane protein assembly factor BamB